MWCADNWSDYTLLDTSDGERLERWGKYTVVRPDPQVIWSGMKKRPEWKKPDARYSRKGGGGAWEENKLPQNWKIGYENLGLVFEIRAMGFKHMGLFPEQAANWDWFSELIKKAGRPIKVLNLFAYTGGATVAAAKAGAAVTHVDAAKGMVNQAKENARLCGLENAPIRYIVDDCRKFCEREIRRGNRYDAVIMDPPSYGRGPNGQVWKLEECVCDLVSLTAGLLSDEPLFFLLNSYTTGLSASTMGYVLETVIASKRGGKVYSDELGLRVKETGIPLPCGAASRWIAK